MAPPSSGRTSRESENCARGLKTVMPRHINGPAVRASTPRGSLNTAWACARTIPGVNRYVGRPTRRRDLTGHAPLLVRPGLDRFFRTFRFWT